MEIQHRWFTRCMSSSADSDKIIRDNTIQCRDILASHGFHELVLHCQHVIFDLTRNRILLRSAPGTWKLPIAQSIGTG